MARFSAIDLNALPAPSTIIPLDHDALVEARLAELEAQLRITLPDNQVQKLMDVARNLPSSPIRYLQEAAAARELYLQNQIHVALQSVLLATAQGSDLDHIGAGRGVARHILDDSKPDALLYESDDGFRARIQLALEAFSPHGAEGSYVYWALDADPRVVDVVAYGPNHRLDPPIPPAEPLIVILSREGNGRADAELQQIVYRHLIHDKRRPVADKVTVRSADPIGYVVKAELHIASAASAQPVITAAHYAAQAFTRSRLRIGRKLYRSSLAAVLRVKGVVDVALESPTNDLDIGPFEAGYCAGIELSVRSISGGWRDV